MAIVGREWVFGERFGTAVVMVAAKPVKVALVTVTQQLAVLMYRARNRPTSRSLP